MPVLFVYAPDIIEILDHKLVGGDEISFKMKVKIKWKGVKVKWLKRCNLSSVKSQKYKSYYAKYGATTYSEFVKAVKKIKAKALLKPGKSTSTTPRKWKPYEEKFVLAMHGKGKTVKQMSDKLNRTEGAITQKLSKLQKAKLICPQCNQRCNSEKGVKIHIGRAHKKKHRMVEDSSSESESSSSESEEDSSSESESSSSESEEDSSSESESSSSESEAPSKKKHKKSKKRKREEISTNNSNKNTVTVHNHVVLQKQEVEIREPPKKKQKPNPKEEWTKNEVAQWVRSLGSDYPKYADKIQAAGFDGEVMCASDASDLVDFVDSKTHRKIIF
eukprot:273383_1